MPPTFVTQPGTWDEHQETIRFAAFDGEKPVMCAVSLEALQRARVGRHEPQGVHPEPQGEGNRMPFSGFTDPAEVEDVVAYLKTLQ